MVVSNSMEKNFFKKAEFYKTPCLLVFTNKTGIRNIELKHNMTIGRAIENSACDIQISSSIISLIHGRFFYNIRENRFYYIDLKSSNGTFLNGQKLPIATPLGSKPYRLTDGDIIKIDRSNTRLPHQDAVLIIFRTSFSDNEIWRQSIIPNRNFFRFSIGSDLKNYVVISDHMVSPVHAIIEKRGTSSYIYDNSANGVSVNGYEIKDKMQLYPYDIIRIAETTIIYAGNRLLYSIEKSNIKSSISKVFKAPKTFIPKEDSALIIDIEEKTIHNKLFLSKTLLKDVHIQVSSGDFVLILGGSGAGKTTFIKAVLGESKANGKITLDGQDLYKNFKTLKFKIGVVPQFSTLRDSDTVRSTILDAAKMKLPNNYNRKEIQKRTDEIIQQLGLKSVEKNLISKISGGQKKRTAVAVQLVGFQKVFILDEPDSGLDAASRIQQMEIMKDISKEGKIVMVVTHEPNDAQHLFTKVIVLAKSKKDNAGHLAYYGKVQDALNFFGVRNLQDIVIQINSVSEGGKGRADEFIEKFKKFWRL